jgi:6-phosphogluconolactonase
MNIMKITLRYIGLFIMLLPLIVQGQKEILYTGTYSERGSEGLYVYKFDRGNEVFSLLETHPEIKDPNFIAIHPSNNFLFCVNTDQSAEGKKYDAATSFKINPEDGSLQRLNQVPTHGKGACHISIDREGNWVFISHYSSGTMSVLPVLANGTLGDTIQTIKFTGSSITRRQQAPHIHSILVSPDNRFVYVADLGSDKTWIFRLDQETGRVTPALHKFAESEPGSGPRHFVFHPINDYLFLAEELSNTVTVFQRDGADGSLTPVQRLSTLPVGFSDRNTVADIHITSDGKWLMVTNRGHNSIALFGVGTDSELTFINTFPVEGDHPRNFMIDPGNTFVMVANRNTDNISFFRFNAKESSLQFEGKTLKIPAPVCLRWLKLEVDK